MEKLLVVGGIWAMCAMCAVLFIRGASSTQVERRERFGERTGRKRLDGTAQ
jgi:hypothetical protein